MTNETKHSRNASGPNPRVDREIQSRPQGNRQDISWTPPSVLPEPDQSKHPDWTHRWVRVDVMGSYDQRNLSLRMREGWVPCPAEEYPEVVQSLSPNDPRGLTPSVNKDVATNGNIIIGGLMLCRMPKEVAQARQKYYADLATRQMEGVNSNLMREEHPLMPIINQSKSRTAFGKGSARDSEE